MKYIHIAIFYLFLLFCQLSLSMGDRTALRKREERKAITLVKNERNPKFRCQERCSSEERDDDCHFPQFTLLPIKLWKHILFFATEDLLYVLQVHPEDYKDILKTRLLFRVLCKVINSFSLKDLFPTIERSCEKLIFDHHDDVVGLITIFSKKNSWSHNQEELMGLFFQKGLVFHEHKRISQEHSGLVFDSSSNKNHKLTKQLIKSNTLGTIYDMQLVRAILLQDKDLITILLTQCYHLHHGEYNVCRLKKSYSVTENYSALNLATGTGNVKMLQMIMEHCLKFDRVAFLEKFNNDINSALVNACHLGFIEIVKYLYPYASNPNDSSKYGYRMNPFKTACAFGHLEIVKELLNAPQIDLNNQDFKGETALMIASYLGRIEIVEELLNYSGIDLNLQNSEGYTALIFAFNNGHQKIFEKLLNHFS